MSRWRARFLGTAAALTIAAVAPSAALAAGGRAHAAPTARVAGKLVLYLPDAFFVARQPVTVPRRVVHVAGIVRPYVAGQWVVVRSYLGGRLLKSEKLPVKLSRNRQFGRFTEALSSPGVGDVTITAVHARTARQTRFEARRHLSALDEGVGFGSTGTFVRLIQQQLAALHFYIPQTGVYDEGTGLALDAYHRLLGWGTYQTLDGRTISWLLDGYGAFRVRDPGHGRHAEGNLSLQLLALINGRDVYRIYPISSGKPSTPTVVGHFHVYTKTPGYLPDGMYYSNFFDPAGAGYAIHGYDPAPDYPASHGCMRLPIVDAISVFDWLNIGNRVDIYY